MKYAAARQVLMSKGTAVAKDDLCIAQLLLEARCKEMKQVAARNDNVEKDRDGRSKHMERATRDAGTLVYVT